MHATSPAKRPIARLARLPVRGLVAVIVVTYLLLQIERVSSTSLAYSLANGVGAAMILFSLWFEFNLSAFLVEFFWLVISLIGIARFMRRRDETPA